MRALIVDDSRAIRSLVGNILRGVGFEVFDASNGCEALERLRQIGKPDVVLIDWNMPEMDGFTFLRVVRADPNYDDVRLMMLTTETEVARMTQALEAGANEYVTKPFTKDIILEKLALMGVLA